MYIWWQIAAMATKRLNTVTAQKITRNITDNSANNPNIHVHHLSFWQENEKELPESAWIQKYILGFF
jgi:hypothetical protein